jgi:hypothetical protein
MVAASSAYRRLLAYELRPGANAPEPNPVLDRTEGEWKQLQRRLRG